MSVFTKHSYLLRFGSGPNLNPFPNKSWFLRVCSKRVLKTLREKEKLLPQCFLPIWINFCKLRQI